MHRQRLTLAVVCAATAMLMLDMAVVNTAVPHIASDLHASLQGVQWLVDAYTVALAATVLSAGSTADRFGRRRCFTVGLVLFTLMSGACGAATSMPMLDLFRAAQGVGAAIMFATSFALISDAYPDPSNRGSAFAAYGATIGASFALGPLAGGALTSWFGWRAVFLINIPIGVVVLACIRGIADGREARPRSIDWVGQTLLIGGLLPLITALLRGHDIGWGSTPVLAMLTGATVSLAAFTVVQRRSREPMLPPALFYNLSFTGAQLTAFAISASFFSQFIYASFYLQNVVGLSPIRTGLAFLPSTLIVFAVSAFAAKLQARCSARALLTAGMSTITGGLLLMLIVGVHSSWLAIVPGEVLAGIGTGLFNPALSAVVLREATRGMTGLAAGINDTARQTGIAVGVAALGALIPANANLGAVHRAGFVHGLHHATLAAAILAAAGAFAASALIDRNRHPSANSAGQQTASVPPPPAQHQHVQTPVLVTVQRRASYPGE